VGKDVPRMEEYQDELNGTREAVNFTQPSVMAAVHIPDIPSPLLLAPTVAKKRKGGGTALFHAR